MKKALLSILFFSTLSSFAQTSIWGVTTAGGYYNAGTIFNTDGSGDNFAVKESFFRYDGDFPKSHLLQASNGKLYGMTASCCTLEAYSVLFEYDPVTKGYDKKFDFNDTVNGGSVYGGLIQATDGKLYGLASRGGAYNYGIIFQYDPSTSVFKKMFDFDDIQGSIAVGSLFEAPDGKLYGLTSTGGIHDYGTLFQFDPATKVFVKKFDFDGVTSGGNPMGALILSKNGKLYGLTSSGGKDDAGTIFEYDLSTSAVTTKFQMNGVSDGAFPYGSLIEATDGNMYGITSSGGLNKDGVLFQYNPGTSGYNVKSDFDFKTIGGSPQSSLIQASNGKLYGSLQSGAAHGNGSVFQFDILTDQLTKIYDFDDENTAGGKTPYSSFMQAKDGYLYSMSYDGGISDAGVLYRVDITNGTYKKEFDFHYGPMGTYPIGGLALAKDKMLYGTSQFGGIKNDGTIFQYDPSLGTYQKMFDFDNSLFGKSPIGSLLIGSDGNLYGAASYGGKKDKGVLFQFNPVTKVYTVKVEFDGLSGSNPVGELIQTNDGEIYGTTREGGITDEGVLFKYSPVSGNYTKLADFGGIDDGKYPEGGLTLGDDGKLYGVTTSGGVNNSIDVPDGFGALFQYDIVTQTYTKKIDFDGVTNGSNPNGMLVKTVDGKLFGMASSGALSGPQNPAGFGTIFQYDPASATISTKFKFNGAASGSNPNGTLLLASNGNLYGLTNEGGASKMGVMFQFDPVNSMYTKKMDLKQINGKFGVRSKLIEIPSTNSIAENNKSLINMHIYPNPGKELITLKLDQIVNKATLKMVTIAGQTVMENTNMTGDHFSLNIASLAPGIYFVELKENNYSSRMKLIKE